MSKEKRKETSKSKKEQKMTAAERRKLQRERERMEYGEDDPFAAFETPQPKHREKQKSNTLSSSLSNFDVNKTEATDDYFERLYGGYTKNKANKVTENEADENDTVKNKHSVKNNKSRELTEKQRKTRMRLSYVFVFSLVVVTAFLMSLTVMFKTTDIIVKGDNIPYSKEEIIEVSGLNYNENIFLAKRKAAVKKIVSKYPYIEAAEVTFHIPGTQIITLQAAIPSYQVAVGEGYAIVSLNGRVLEIVSSQRANIPLLKGLKLTDSREGEYISFEKKTTQQILNEVITNINDNQVPNIYGIDISNSASIKLNYDNRITILIGVPEDVGYKLRTAMAIINKELAANDKGDLDVSLANSDRKSSYFTPYYSNTVAIDDTASSSTASSITSSRKSTSGETTDSVDIKSAEDYLNEINSRNSASKQTESYDVDFDDIIEDEDYYEDDEEAEAVQEDISSGTNIRSDYGTSGIN